MGGKSYYYLTDATGNVLGLVDDADKRTHTYAYGPTGLPRGTTTEAVPQPHRYTGAYLDPTGLYKMGHRYYDPSLGRFTQPDPSGQESNRFLYAAGDFINNSDPTGLFGFSDALDVGEKIFSAATGCLAGIGAAGETGILTAATGFFGAPGGVAAGVLACGAGAGAALIGADIISYG